jgi:hypothetical protein
MRPGIVVLIFLIIVMVVASGCTSSSGAAAGSKSRTSGSGSSITPASTQGYSIPQNMRCSDNCPDMNQFEKYFPAVDGWRNNRPQLTGMGYCGISERYDELPDNKNQVIITIRDFSPCNYGADFYVKNLPAGEISTGANGTMAYTAITYHGFPTLQITFADKKTSVVGIGRMIVINPKLSIEIDAGNGSEPEVDARIGKFANAIDFNGLALVGDTGVTHIPTTNPVSHTISVTARYSQDGTITVTNNGGKDVADLTTLTVSVNGAAPVSLGATAGSKITVQGIAGSKNQVIATGTFRDGVQQVVFMSEVGP